jgi:hypothetical protein
MRKLVAVLIWLFYKLRLRPAFNWLQRRAKGEHKATRAPLPRFSTPASIEEYIRFRFSWRADSGRLGGIVFPLDWISDAEIFHARVLAGESGHGDCDDYHNFFAVALRTLVGVGRVYLVSSGFRKGRFGGGHTTCVFEYRSRWYHVDYGIKEIDDPNLAPYEVARARSDDGSTYVPWAVFEDEYQRAAAVQNIGRELRR